MNAWPGRALPAALMLKCSRQKELRRTYLRIASHRFVCGGVGVSVCVCCGVVWSGLVWSGVGCCPAVCVGCAWRASVCVCVFVGVCVCVCVCVRVYMCVRVRVFGGHRLLIRFGPCVPGGDVVLWDDVY